MPKSKQSKVSGYSLPSHIPTETHTINGREFVAIPYAAVLAMTSDELAALFPDGQRIVAEGVRAGAMAREAKARRENSTNAE